MGKQGVTARHGVIRTTRLEVGMSASTLATRARLSHGHLSNIERGKRAASPDVAGRIAATLGKAAGVRIPVKDLFTV